MKIVMRKRYKNADEGVVLAAIQVAVDSDLSAEQRRRRVQHMYSPGTLLLFDPARGEEKLRENSGSTTAWWWWSSWFSGRASPSTTEEEDVLERESEAPKAKVRSPPSPHYI